MTEEQIKEMGLSDKRERALLAVKSHLFERKDFWALVSERRWGLAAQALETTWIRSNTTQFLADAIWEG